jgi:hypothetical protein
MEGNRAAHCRAEGNYWQASNSRWDRPKGRARAAGMWKTRIFTVFLWAIVKNMRFSSVFRGFSLAFSKSLGYSAHRPGFFGAPKERVRGWPPQLRGSRKKSGG